jgi:hypothetical protein
MSDAEYLQGREAGLKFAKEYDRDLFELKPIANGTAHQRPGTVHWPRPRAGGYGSLASFVRGQRATEGVTVDLTGYVRRRLREPLLYPLSYGGPGGG